MKIIKIGYSETKVKCLFCKSEYKFDSNDIKKEIDEIEICPPHEPSITGIITKKYVCCPVCKEKFYIKDFKTGEENDL